MPPGTCWGRPWPSSSVDRWPGEPPAQPLQLGRGLGPRDRHVPCVCAEGGCQRRGCHQHHQHTVCGCGGEGGWLHSSSPRPALPQPHVPSLVPIRQHLAFALFLLLYFKRGSHPSHRWLERLLLGWPRPKIYLGMGSLTQKGALMWGHRWVFGDPSWVVPGRE